MTLKSQMRTIPGLATSRGFAVGPVFIYRGDSDMQIPQYLISSEQVPSELERLRSAAKKTRTELDELIVVLKNRADFSNARIFECHLMLLEDDVLWQQTESYISEEHLNAEAAVLKTLKKIYEQFSRIKDPYFRERVRDVEDVEKRLLKALTGFKREIHLELKTPSIIVADDLTPSETVQLPYDMVLGFATNGGSTTSHVALLARNLGIPSVTGLGNITSRVTPGSVILLDGTGGTVTVNPDHDSVLQFTELMRRNRESVKIDGVLPGTLKDGTRVHICVNLHKGVPMSGLKNLGVNGIGLYRSEFLWIDREHDPSEEEQFEAYREVAEVAKDFGENARAVIRLLDIGGDKMMRGVRATEANPFLGNRSIRYLLSHRDVLRTQLRAILRASAFGPTAMMYPMVSCVEELTELASELQLVKRQLNREMVDFDDAILVGAMIEVPSAALNADQLAPFVDFFSIGTNDLVQYTMAADRGNDAVSYLYQPLNPAIIRLVRMTVGAAQKHGIGIAVCGESASDPVVGTFWVALGVDTLSMSASFVPDVTKILSGLTRRDLNEYAKVPSSLPASATAKEIFLACQKWLVARGVLSE